MALLSLLALITVIGTVGRYARINPALVYVLTSRHRVTRVSYYSMIVNNGNNRPAAELNVDQSRVNVNKVP